jgi:cytochrome P450
MTTPGHVPQELVRPFPFPYGVKVKGDPFADMIARTRDFPDVFFANNIGPGGTPAWILRRASDLRSVYLDTEHFTTEDFAPFAKILGANWNLLPVEVDPPRHAAYRAIIQPLFTPAAINRLDNQIRDFARQGIQAFCDKGECDYLEDLAYKFPIRVFLGLMGLPQEMTAQFLSWETALLHNDDMAVLAGAARSLVEYLSGEIASRRSQPRDDLITYLVKADFDGRKLTDDELIGFTFLLFIGGLDTVSANMGLHAAHLATHPEHQGFLRANPQYIPDAIEELMRVYSPVSTFRTCIKPTRINGVEVEPGDKVLMCTTLAGRDAKEYPDPHDVRLDRKPRHNAFGFGVHHCVGLHLARRELRVAIEEFLTSIGEFRIKPGHELEYYTGVLQPVSLPLTW